MPGIGTTGVPRALAATAVLAWIMATSPGSAAAQTASGWPAPPDLRLRATAESMQTAATDATMQDGDASSAATIARGGGQRVNARSARPAALPRLPELPRPPASPGLPNEAVTPIRTATTTANSEEAAQGLRLGAFRLQGEVEEGIVFVSRRGNEDRPAVGLRFAPDLRLVSNWPRHELQFFANGEVIAYSRDGVEARGQWGAALQLDARRDLRLRLTLDHAVDEVDATTADNALQHEVSANAAVEWQRNRLTASLRGGVLLHEEPGNARDYLQPQAGLRLRLRTAPALAVYGEVGADARRYRRDTANNDSLGGFIEAGVELLRGPIWEGRLGLQLAARDYRDAAQARLFGAGLSGNLDWRPTRDTTIGLNATFDLNDEAAGRSRQQTLSLSLRQRIRRGMEGDARLQVERNDIIGGADTLTLRASAALSWQVWRRLWIVGRYGFERSYSGDFGRASGAPEHRFGLSLRQRF